jgi:4-hydroxybenzoate polyprenyltransferase
MAQGLDLGFTSMTSPSASESSPRPDLSDMRPNNDWVARYLPASWGPYARLCRLDRPVGTWLTLLPALAALVQAADGIPTLWRVVIFSLGALLMRGIGCCFNDMADRNFDHQVERTRFRPHDQRPAHHAQGRDFRAGADGCVCLAAFCH